MREAIFMQFFFVKIVDMAIRLFALGLFVYIVLQWMSVPRLWKVQRFLERIYEPLLNPIRRCIRPVRIFPDAPGAIDLSPLILLLLLWLFVHPFLMWVLGAR